MDNKTNEIVLFKTSDEVLKFSVPVIDETDETVWLNRNQIADLFGRNVKIIEKHIRNALKEELDDSTVAKIAIVQKTNKFDKKYRLYAVCSDFSFIQLSKTRVCG